VPAASEDRSETASHIAEPQSAGCCCSLCLVVLWFPSRAAGQANQRLYSNAAASVVPARLACHEKVRIFIPAHETCQRVLRPESQVQGSTPLFSHRRPNRPLPARIVWPNSGVSGLGDSPVYLSCLQVLSSGATGRSLCRWYCRCTEGGKVSIGPDGIRVRE